MSEQFDALENQDIKETEKVETVVDNSKENKKALAKEAASEYHKDVKENPELKEKSGIWQQFVDLTHTCGYGGDGNLIQIKKANKATGEGRELGYTAAIVGYGLTNISEDIEMPYVNEIFSRTEDGEIVSEVKELVLKPGEEAYFTKKYAAIFLTKPEFNMVIRNARLTKVNLEEVADLDAMLSKTVMKFNSKVTSSKVNDDDIKINISEVVGTVPKRRKSGEVVDENEYKVKDAFFSIFGGYDIPKNKEKAAGEDKTKMAMAATSNQIQKMYAEARKAQ